MVEEKCPANHPCSKSGRQVGQVWKQTKISLSKCNIFLSFLEMQVPTCCAGSAGCRQKGQGAAGSAGRLQGAGRVGKVQAG